MTTTDLMGLQVLLAVQEHRSMGAAAQALGMAQPNVSRMIARLERSWQLRVVERTARGSELTPEGVEVALSARALLQARDSFDEVVHGIRDSVMSHVTVAASVTVAEYLAPAWLSRFRGAHPGVELRLHVCNSREVLRRAQSGSADIGFVEGPETPRGLHARTVAVDRLVLVVGPRHPWAGRVEPVGIHELAATPLVMREIGSGTRETLERALAPLSAAPPTMQLSSNAAVMGAVRDGAGPAVLSELAVRERIEVGWLCEVPLDPQLTDSRFQRRLRAVWKPPLPANSPVAHLLDLALGRDGRS